MRILALIALLAAAACPLMAQIDLSDPTEPWLETAFGVTQDVPPPFEPVTIGGSTASIWGREYALAGPLPAQMTSQGEPLLAAPMRLVLESGGEEHVFAGGEVSVDMQRDDRVEFSSTSEAGGFTVSTANWLEYDGVIQVNLTVSGAGTVDRLSLEIPIAPERALFLHEHAQWGGYDYLHIPEEADWTRAKGWHAQTWIGDHDRGITFVTEHPGDLSGPPESQIEYERTDDAVVFRANLLGEPTEVDGEMTWTLGLQASPGKPLPVGWPGRHVGTMGPGGAGGGDVGRDPGPNLHLGGRGVDDAFVRHPASPPPGLDIHVGRDAKPSSAHDVFGSANRVGIVSPLDPDTGVHHQGIPKRNPRSLSRIPIRQPRLCVREARKHKQAQEYSFTGQPSHFFPAASHLMFLCQPTERKLA